MDMPAGQTQLRILLLEDEPTDAELVENALHETGMSFVSRRVDTREAFMQALEEFKPDIVLADYKLPAFDGASAVKIVRQQHPTIPVVMVTGAMGDEKAVELLGLGAKDYILKDRLARLGPAVQRALSAELGIRARKAAEKALRESEAKFRAVFENAKDVILALSTDGTLILLNPAFEQITGWTCAEWLGKSFSPLVHPDDLPDAMHLLQCAVQGEALPVFELRILKKTGGHVVGEFTITPLVHDGTNAYLLGIARDITGRKQMEDALKEASERNRAIMETANDAIICMKPDGTVHLWNHKAEEMFGYTAAEAIGQKMHQLIASGQYRGKAIDGLEQFTDTGAGYVVGKTLELTALRKDGTEFPVELSVSSMNIRGEWHATGIIRDITERKQAEAALARNARDLGERVKETKCLYDITKLLLDKESSIGTILNACTQRIPAGWLDPSHTCARIRLGDQTFETANCRETEWKLAAAIPSPGMEPGLIEVFYFGEMSGGQESPFLDEEQDLIHAIATQIAQSLESRQAEARIQKLTRLYATLSQTNGAIVRTTNREELFVRICESAVTHGKFIMAWVGLVDEAARMVKPVCHHGAEQGYLTDIVISTDDVPAGRGPTGTAIRENRVFCVNDYASDERTLPWRDAALKRGFRGAAGVPLRFKGKAIGAMTLYADEVNFFDAEQLNLLEEMATDISFALEGFEREALRQKAEEGRGTALHKLRKALEDSIRVAASISEVRDPYTAGHQQRVSQLAVAIAREMGLPAAQVEGIHFGGLIHDIGKVGVPAEILSKPSILSPLEMELIQIHPEAGYEIVKEIEFPWPVAQMILQHHERQDGSGYPARLKGEEIILEARIIAVADTVEAMSSHRPYRPGLGMNAALEEISGASGVRYDSQAVEACLRLIREKGFTFN